MNVLIIYSHPNHQSLNFAILEQVEKGLTEANHKVNVIDLYEEEFQSSLIFNKEKRRRDLNRDPETEKYREMIAQSDQLIFIYPIWWSMPPAILKGFIDRVFVSGFAFTYFKGVIPKGLLKGKSAWVIYTADTPGILLTLMERSAEWRYMKRILKIFGFSNIKRFRIAGVRFKSEVKINQHLDLIYQQSKNI
ncbi:NAD(P)H-dependent oxidoreductase [Jeotgalibacillus sp. ET6]|uniref:NAD(P)H-dependent oxidoreductase n=1 Tax=Jeotgalibacillus sp. ET6 TaxID=3037260 RepID=UPI002418379E|nr:NAD(P)H-dependent oxidoreductase [Jeotgalibacillus sp. ET6]MDG5471297.1 NAD(P)H-dependent oxidoreductase [Jeotgalibacillus sp. ET6]